jgi:peptidoglycan hydrolase-like protein with peptidoglycan-binding domain
MFEKIQIGSHGSQVEDWQRVLRREGLKGLNGSIIKDDGSFGPSTAFATKVFQKAHALPETGVVDSATYDAGMPATTPDGIGRIDLSSVKFVQARNYTRANRQAIDVIVIHCMEWPDKPDGAERVSAWFASDTAPKASAHFCVDSNSIVQCVRVEDVAWHAPGANGNGIG